jgi:hypothetical protein
MELMSRESGLAKAEYVKRVAPMVHIEMGLIPA